MQVRADCAAHGEESLSTKGESHDHGLLLRELAETRLSDAATPTCEQQPAGFGEADAEDVDNGVKHAERRPGKVRCDRHDLRCDEPGHGERKQERIRTAPRRKHARGLSADENEEHGKHERRAHAS